MTYRPFRYFFGFLFAVLTAPLHRAVVGVTYALDAAFPVTTAGYRPELDFGEPAEPAGLARSQVFSFLQRREERRQIARMAPDTVSAALC